MIYHQTKQEQQHDILTVLSTFASIYDHVDISNNTVELHNELCIYIYIRLTIIIRSLHIN